MYENEVRSNFEFGEFRLDAEKHRLSRIASDEQVRIVPKAIELLIALIRNRDRVVSKDELLQDVWKGAFIEDSNISQTIFVLRKTLGDNPKDPKLILTIPNHGYRFIGEVVETQNRSEFSPEDGQNLDRRGTNSANAYRAYVRGRHFWNKRTSVSLKAAVAHFEHAIEQDPKFVQAYNGLADCHRLLSEYYSTAVPVEARNAPVHGIIIDEKLAEAHASLAYAQAFYDWDWAGAEISFKKALELNPNHVLAHQRFAEVLCVHGRFSEALSYIERGIELEPDSTGPLLALAVFHYLQRNADELIAQSRKIIALDPDSAYGHFYLGFGFEFKGMFREAVETLGKTAVLFGEPEECAKELIDAYHRNGMTGVWHMRLEQYASRPHLKNYPPYLKSLVPARIGDLETSLALLNEAYDQRDRGIIYAKYEPFLEPLRDDPRFRILITRIGL